MIFWTSTSSIIIFLLLIIGKLKSWREYQLYIVCINVCIKILHFYMLFTTTVFVLFATSAWTLYSHIICIICIYNITCISGFSRLGNIYIICIICTIYIINISLLWTNCGHRPHPFTAIIIPYFKVQ